MKSSPGFTMIEVLISVGLFALVAAALVGIQAMGIRTQKKAVASTIVDNSATSAAKTLRRLASAASYVETPEPGAGSQHLTLWENVDPDTRARILPGVVPRVAHFCADGDSARQLYLYEGPMDPPSPAAPPVAKCGDEPGGGLTRLLVVGGMGGQLTIDAWFYRPPGEDNVLQMSYSVELTTSTDRQRGALSVVHQTQVALRGRRSL